MKRTVARALMFATFGCAGIAAPAVAAPYTAIYSFGDSLSDVGNVYLATSGAEPAAPYVAGRFSNGPNWIDDLSASLGLGAVRPSLAGGNDFAFGGAVTGTSVPQPAPLVPTITQQIGLFTQATGGHASPTALYTFWIGSNDVLDAIADIGAGTLTPTQAAADVTQAAQTAAAALAALVGEGARSFLVPLVPNLGDTPDVNTTPALVAIATSLSEAYNQALTSAIGTQTAGAGVTVDYLDTFSLITGAVADPAAFGLTDVTDRCYVGPYTGGGSVCATPSTYLFWDGLHPTATGYALVAQAALTAVPEPAAVLVMVVGITGMLAFRRRV